MAARTTRYRSHSPTPSPTHTYEQPQPLTTAVAIRSMTLEARGSQDNVYGGRNDLTFPPYSRNLVVGNGAPNSPRQSNYNQTYPLSPSRDAKNHPRNNRPAPIPENEAASKRQHYSYEESTYSEFAQTKPPIELHDSEPLAHRLLPSIANSQYTNGTRLPPLNPSAYHTNYNSNPDAHMPRQLSINSIISSPGTNTPSANYSSFGNGSMKKRKKSYGAESDRAEENIDTDDREREHGQATGDNGSHKANPNVGLGVGLEDPDVRLAAEALGDLRADLNNSGISGRHQNHLQLSTTSSSSSSAANTGLNSPLSPSQASNQFARHLNPEDTPILDLIQNNPNPVLRAASAAGRLSATAYTTSKTLSPRFKHAAEQFESVAKGRIGGAVGSLVSTVGKRSGLESLVRRSLANSVAISPESAKEERRLPPPLSLLNGNAKKRKTSSREDTVGNGVMSPAPILGGIPEEQKALQKQPPQDTQQQNWQTRLILSTSGIGAVSEESLKSLKYCLEWLRWANNHLGKCIETLKTVLEEYERNKQSMDGNPNSAQNPQTDDARADNNPGAVTTRNQGEPEERKQMLMGTIERLKSEVLKTLKKVINVVDSYAGGALVGETRNMVKRQLLHLPQRLQIALVAHTPGADGNGNVNEQSVTGPAAAPAGGDPAASAQRVIIVAKEGLDMMHNVTKLVEIALVGAEEWFEKLGRKSQPEEKSGGGDVKMVEAGQESTIPNKQITENGERRDAEGDVKMEC